VLRNKSFQIFLVVIILINIFACIAYAGDVSGVSSLAPTTSFDVMKDNQSIPDTLFFGVWDGTKWKTQYHPLDKSPDNANYKPTPITSLLQYSKLTSFPNIEAYVKQAGTSGDYSMAKAALLEYFRTSRSVPTPTYSAYSLDLKWGDSAYENFYSGQGYQYTGGETTVTNTEGWYSIPVSSALQFFSLWAIDKVGADVLLHSTSNTSGNKPYLLVTTSKGTYKIDATEGTYIRAGVFADSKFSSENLWKIREDGMPVSDFTSRTFLNFPVGNYDLSGFQSASIYFYGNLNTTDSAKNVRVIASSTNVPGLVSNFCWNTTTVGNWNYTDQMFDRYDVYDYSPPSSAEFEWINSTSRFPREFSNAQKYVATNDEKYAKATIQHILAYYQTRNEWQPRILDSSWRAQNLHGTFFLLLNSQYMTPEVCTMFLKMLEYTAQICKAAPLPPNNQGSVFVAGAIDLACYFPELITQDYWAYTINRAKDLYNNIVYSNYGGYIEADAGSYTQMVINHIVGIIKNIRDIRGETPEKFWYDKLDNMIRYRINYLWPNLISPNYADAGGDYPVANIKTAATLLNSDAITYGYPEYVKNSQEYLWIVNKGQAGTKPTYTSALIPKSKLWMMRTDLINSNALALSGSLDNTSYHKHDHPLNIDVYAYGKLLLRESGSREYSTGTERELLPLRAAYHNTITYIDGNGILQRIPSTSEADRDTSEIIKEWTTTNKVDYIEAYTNSLKGINKSVTRKVLFLKELGFWVVSDLVKNENLSNTTNYTFTQTWSPNLYHNATVDSTTKIMKTNYINSANIYVVPADPNELSWVTATDKIDPNPSIQYTGTPFSYQLLNFIPSTKLMYAKQQQSGGDVTFDTVLYPIETGDTTTVVSVDRLPVTYGGISVDKAVATALKVNINQNEKAYYYNSQDKSGVARKFGNYSTNSNVAFIDNDESLNKLKSFNLTQGSYIRDENLGVDLVTLDSPVKDFGLTYNNDTVDIQSSVDISSLNFSFYAPNIINKVLINGVESTFRRDNNRMYIPNPDDIDPVSINSVTSNVNNTEHPASATIDNDMQTYWESDGVSGDYLQYKLANSTAVRGVSIAFNNGVASTFNFKIDVSGDGTTWRNALPETTSTSSADLVKYLFNKRADVQYVRITFTENKAYQVPSVSIWQDTSVILPIAQTFTGSSGSVITLPYSTSTSIQSGWSLDNSVKNATPSSMPFYATKSGSDTAMKFDLGQPSQYTTISAYYYEPSSIYTHNASYEFDVSPNSQGTRQMRLQVRDKNYLSSDIGPCFIVFSNASATIYYGNATTGVLTSESVTTPINDGSTWYTINLDFDLETKSSHIKITNISNPNSPIVLYDKSNLSFIYSSSAKSESFTNASVFQIYKRQGSTTTLPLDVKLDNFVYRGSY